MQFSLVSVVVFLFLFFAGVGWRVVTHNTESTERKHPVPEMVSAEVLCSLLTFTSLTRPWSGTFRPGIWRWLRIRTFILSLRSVSVVTVHLVLFRQVTPTLPATVCVGVAAWGSVAVLVLASVPPPSSGGAVVVTVIGTLRKRVCLSPTMRYGARAT